MWYGYAANRKTCNNRLFYEQKLESCGSDYCVVANDMKVWRLWLSMCIVLGWGEGGSGYNTATSHLQPSPASPAQPSPAQTGMQSPFVGAGVTFPDTDWEQQCNAHYDGRGHDTVSRLAVSLHKNVCPWIIRILLPFSSKICADAKFGNALSYSYPLKYVSHWRLSPGVTWNNLYDCQYSCNSECFFMSSKYLRLWE